MEIRIVIEILIEEEVEEDGVFLEEDEIMEEEVVEEGLTVGLAKVVHLRQL